MSNRKLRLVFFLLTLALAAFGSAGISEAKGGGKKSCVPSPPPSCNMLTGCYNNLDKHVDFGSLAPEEFGSYYGVNACVRSTTPNGCGGTNECTCPSGAYVEQVKETSPDSSSGSCNCIAGTTWDTRGRCCGKSADDCGRISKGVLCSIDANAETATWIVSSPNQGDIRYVGCNRAEYLSDGSTWIKCDGSFWRTSIGNSEYICIGQGRESIVECCGDGSCKSKIDGKRLSTGQSANPSSFANEQAPPAPGTLQISPRSLSINIGQTARLQAVYSSLQNTSVVEADWNSQSPNIASVAYNQIPCSIPSQQNCLDFSTVVVTGVSSGTAVVEARLQLDTGRLVRALANVVVSPNTLTGQVVSITGNTVAAADTKTYYCRADRKFVTDLDVPNSQLNDKALLALDKSACEKAGFAWTGTKCCSEDDDVNEFYNDAGGSGGCFDKTPVLSVSLAANNSIINFNGEFHGCAIKPNTQFINNTDVLGIKDSHTGAPLITNNDYCFNDPGKNYYCSFSGQWQPTNGADKSHLSYAPIVNVTKAAGCCTQDECFDGSNCIANQKNNPLAQPIGNGSRCVDGQWTQSAVACTIDCEVKGFCPKTSQCLANVFGQSSGQCIESGDYIEDNLCDNGGWTSRTKLLALKLLSLKSNDFTLFCDNRENTLNNLQYLTDSNELASSMLEGFQTNNFCILKSGSRVVAAASINKNLEDIPSQSLNIFGVTDCSAALIDDNAYHPCDTSNKVWFNKHVKSFIYSSTPINIPSGAASFDDFIGNPIKAIIGSIKRLVANPPFDESYVNGLKKFDKLYITQQGGRAIIGSVEGTKFKNAVIEYTGFDADICRFIDSFNQARKDVSSGISCRKEGSNYFVLAQGSQFTNINPDDIWQDLTSKLRLK